MSRNGVKKCGLFLVTLFLSGGEVSVAGGRASWVWRSGKAWVFICLELSVWRGQLFLQRWRESLIPNMALSLHQWLAPSLSFENSNCQKPFTALY